VLLTALFGLLPDGAGTSASAVRAGPVAASAVSIPAAAGAKGRTVKTRGCDTCEAPTTQTMKAWRESSPYSVVGVYVAGDNRACKSKRLTREWVATVRAQGWDFLPIQVGLQAPCSQSGKPGRIDPARAAAQGTTDANEAVDKASALGFAPGSALWFDMEAYDSSDGTCRTAVLDFVSAWIARVRQRGFLAGYYSSLDSGVRDQIEANGTRWSPDAIWYAAWDGNAVTTGDGAIPDGFWTGRRVHQYTGNVVETHGGVAINIDRNAVEGPVAVF